MPCTTLLAGRKATASGSTFIARNDDSGSTGFTAKRTVVILPKDQPRHYKSVLSSFEIDLPDDPMRYVAFPNTGEELKREGIWAEAGVNAENVSITATETTTSNPGVLGADPLTEKGMGEEDLVTILLPYIHSARDGVLRLGKLQEEYGTYEMNGIAFQDVSEVWWFETIGGHHWIAARVPDDCVVVASNQFSLDRFDFADALGEKKNYMCSPDLPEFVKANHLDVRLSEEDPFNPRDAFGSHSDEDHVYNTPRVWFSQRYLIPHAGTFDGVNADFTPESDDLPWCFVPEKKLTVEDAKYVLSSHFQGTKYDPYAKYGDPSEKGRFRPIGINRNSFLSLVEIRPEKQEEIQSIIWMAFGSNAFNAFCPFYANVNRTPDYIASTTDEVSTENLYWSSRLIGALADSRYHETGGDIDSYKEKVPARGRALVQKFDAEYEKAPVSDVPAYLEKANDEIAAMAKEETGKTLAAVLLHVSLLMENGFSRSDA